MTPEQREALVERIAVLLCKRTDCQAVPLMDGEPLAECKYSRDECCWRFCADDARAALSIAEEEIERGLREAPPRPILPDLTDAELAALGEFRRSDTYKPLSEVIEDARKEGFTAGLERAAEIAEGIRDRHERAAHRHHLNKNDNDGDNRTRAALAAGEAAATIRSEKHQD